MLGGQGGGNNGKYNEWQQRRVCHSRNSQLGCQTAGVRVGGPLRSSRDSRSGIKPERCVEKVRGSSSCHGVVMSYLCSDHG